MHFTLSFAHRTRALVAALGIYLNSWYAVNYLWKDNAFLGQFYRIVTSVYIFWYTMLNATVHVCKYAWIWQIIIVNSNRCQPLRIKYYILIYVMKINYMCELLEHYIRNESIASVYMAPYASINTEEEDYVLVDALDLNWRHVMKYIRTSKKL